MLKSPHLQVYYSSERIAEFDAVINRPKFTKFVNPRHVNRFKSIAFQFLKQTAIGVVPTIVRDADDNYLLGICAGCQADFLITGDQDLLVLGRYGETKIVTMSHFLHSGART
ncbi:putative toxin-antitoxin system toxin component, PIN family [Larkinella ripae]